MFGNNLDKKILKIIENDEKHDNRDIISSIELLKLYKKRFVLMKDILKPIVDILSKELIITDIYFNVESDGMFSINVSYERNNKSGILVLCQIDLDELDLTVGKYEHGIEKIVLDNKKKIIDVFNHGLDNSFDNNGQIIKSTSRLLTISNYNNYFELCNSDTLEQFRILLNYSSNAYNVSSIYPIINDKLKDKNNLDSFLSHVKVYEKSIPHYLIKK